MGYLQYTLPLLPCQYQNVVKLWFWRKSMNIAVYRIRLLAKERGMTLKSVAIAIEVHENNWMNWKTGSPSISTLIKAARFFEVSLDYLVGLTDDRNAYVSATNLPEHMLRIFDTVRRLNPTPHQSLTIQKVIEYLFKFNKKDE